MTVVDGGAADAAPDADADPLLVLAASIEQLAQAAMRPKQIVRGRMVALLAFNRLNRRR